MLIRWLTRHWVSLALVLGLLQLVCAPVLLDHWHWTPYLILVYLQTPIYMLHQVEEHTRDRFRTFFNQQLFHGLDALTPAAVLWTNIPGVWGITLLSLWMAASVAPGWGLIGAYLVAVNAAVHLASWARLRRYNPGLWTAILLFVPLSALTLWKSAGARATWENHLVGLAAAVGIHAVIMIHTGRRAERLRRTAPRELSIP